MKRLVSIVVTVVLTCMAVMVNTAYAEHDSLTGGTEQDNGTEFHVVDDLYVGGWTGTWQDPDAEIYGFSMFGSTTAYNNRWGDWASSLQGKMPTKSTGAVVILGDLVVGSTAYFHRSVEFNAISTFTAGAFFPQYSTVTFVAGSSVTFGSAGNIYINDGDTGQVLTKDSDGSLKWTNASSLGDNLGNHTATQNLNMNNYAIVQVSSMTFSNQSLAISSGSAYFGGANAGITISTNVEVAGQIKAAKFIGDGSGLTGTGDNLGNHIATKTLDMAGYDIIKIKELSLGSSGVVKISTATNQFGGAGNGVLISTHTEVSGQLYVGGAATMASTLNVTGDATMSANLTVNGNATIGDVPGDVHTINGAVTVHANPANKKLMQVDDGTNVVAYFKKK